MFYSHRDTYDLYYIVSTGLALKHILESLLQSKMQMKTRTTGRFRSYCLIYLAAMLRGTWTVILSVALL